MNKQCTTEKASSIMCMNSTSLDVVKSQFIHDLKSKQLLLFIGSGLSRLVGQYGAWNEFLQKIADESKVTLNVKDLANNGNTYPQIASIIEKKAKSKYQIALTKVLREYEATEVYDNAGLHYRLLRLPFSGVITTNYDCIIENVIRKFVSKQTNVENLPPITNTEFGTLSLNSANSCLGMTVNLCDFSDKPRVCQHIRDYLNFGKRYSSVLHLHGEKNNLKNIILTEEDYKRYYNNKDYLHDRVIWSLFLHRPIAFIGFSMDDPFISILINNVFNSFKIGNNVPFHYIFIPEHEMTRMKVNEFANWGGINVWPYSVNGEYYYDALEKVVAELESKSGAGAGIIDPLVWDEKPCKPEDSDKKKESHDVESGDEISIIDINRRMKI